MPKEHCKEWFQTGSYSFSKGPNSMLRELLHSDSPAPRTSQLPQLPLKGKLPHLQHRMSCHWSSHHGSSRYSASPYSGLLLTSLFNCPYFKWKLNENFSICCSCSHAHKVNPHYLLWTTRTISVSPILTQLTHCVRLEKTPLVLIGFHIKVSKQQIWFCLFSIPLPSQYCHSDLRD